MKKKLLTMVLVAGMVLSLTACGSKGDDAADMESPAVEQSSESDTQEEAPASEEPAVEEEAPASEEPAVEEEAPEEEGMTLEEWMQSDEAKQTEEMTNSALASSQITVKLKADGDVFVYEYTMGEMYDGLSDSETTETLDAFIEENAEGAKELFGVFEEEYGTQISAVRFVFLASDGTERYSSEVTND